MIISSMRFVRMALVHGHARNTDKRYQVVMPGQGHSWVSRQVSLLRGVCAEDPV
jgi:broad specificity polyphosphatase/5'/3'-nucleotidase SurE